MTNLRIAKRSGLLAALGLLFAVLVLPGPAAAGVATAGAVLLDPFDPVPEIQFRHFGGYGCDTGCGGYERCDEGCGGRCGDSCGRCHQGCVRHSRCGDGCRPRNPCEDNCGRHDRCDGDCERADRGDNCDTDCDHGGAPPPDARPPCEGRCNVTEHWQRDWRNGGHFGQEWYDRGYRERDSSDGHRPHNWHRSDHDSEDNDDDDSSTPAATPATPATPDKPAH